MNPKLANQSTSNDSTCESETGKCAVCIPSFKVLAPVPWPEARVLLAGEEWACTC